MSHRNRLVTLLFLLFPATAAAQIVDCPNCILGLFDDTSLTSNFGVSVPLVAKDIYVSIDLSGAENQLTGIEFSIAGLTGTPLFVVGVTPIVPTSVVIGSIPAPADTSATTVGIGGIIMAWATCLTGDRALVKVSLLHTVPVSNLAFRVMHRFPTSNGNYNRHPVLVRCDAPTFTAVRINGGCYVLNPSGDPSTPCPIGTVAVTSRTWTGVKQLFQ